jgi:MYXO-CTERM domain-containing protein
VFSVGGTQLERDSSTRGFRETVWAKGGSSCSLSIAKPAYQSMSPCAYRASADLAAVADPRTGVAIYHSRNGGGWRVVGGTSAATPLVAGIFASTGHARRTTNQLAALGGALVDVTEGSNGTCGSKLCKAEAGWDGPTGFGTPNATALAALMVADEPAGSDDDDKADGESSLESAAAGGCSTSGGPGGFGALLVALVASRRRRQAANALTTPQ